MQLINTWGLVFFLGTHPVQAAPSGMFADGEIAICSHDVGVVGEFTDDGQQATLYEMPKASKRPILCSLADHEGRKIVADAANRRIVDYTGGTIYNQERLPFKPDKLGKYTDPLDQHSHAIYVTDKGHNLWVSPTWGAPFEKLDTGVLFSMGGYTSHVSGGINGKHKELIITQFILSEDLLWAISRNTKEVVAFTFELEIVDRAPTGPAPSCIAAQPNRVYVGDSKLKEVWVYSTGEH